MIRVAVIGLGGFASEHHRVVEELERRGACRLVCTCDPEPERFAARAEARDFAGRGVRVYDDYRRMLDAHAGGLDLVTVPTPVPLHAEMHGEVVGSGLACYLEKPPTLWPDELDGMIARDERARLATQVGFNYIVERPRQALKRRLLDGEFGALRRISFRGASARADSYYARAPWAGRLRLGDRPVLDTCLGNAMAHELHNVLFWAGQRDLLDWAAPRTMRAQLYRAHAIQSSDTVFAEAVCEGDVLVRAAATHACDGPGDYAEAVACDLAVLTYRVSGSWRIEWADGRTEEGEADPRDLVLENLAAYLRYAAGEEPRPLTRLVDSRPFVHYHALMFVAAGRVHTVPEDLVRATPNGDAGTCRSICGIDEAMAAFVDDGRFPDEQGLAWGRPGGSAVAADLVRLPGVVDSMAATT